MVEWVVLHVGETRAEHMVVLSHPVQDSLIHNLSFVMSLRSEDNFTTFSKQLIVLEELAEAYSESVPHTGGCQPHMTMRAHLPLPISGSALACYPDNLWFASFELRKGPPLAISFTNLST